MLKRIPKTKLDLVNVKEYKGRNKLEGEKILQPGKMEKKSFVEGECVRVFSKRNNERQWIRGKIAKKVSQYTYLVSVRGEVRYVHAEDLKKDLSNGETSNLAEAIPPVVIPQPPSNSTAIAVAPNSIPERQSIPAAPIPPMIEEPTVRGTHTPTCVSDNGMGLSQRPRRVIKASMRLDL